MKTIIRRFSIGTHIEGACREAAALSKANHCRVRFRFNDIQLEAAPNTSPTTLYNLWNWQVETSSRNYWSSAKGMAEQKRREEELAADQKAVDRLIAVCSDFVAAGLDPTVGWVAAFTGLADRCGLKYDCEALAKQLEAAGYVENEHCDLPMEEYTKKEVFGRYIIGQALSCLKDGLPPHPVLLRFFDEYAKLDNPAAV